LVVLPATTNNTSAPADDPGWANVGDRGVYLGNGWVITANHVGAGATNFPGVGAFAAAPGSEVRLHNPAGSGLSAFTDLLLYRLASDPGLPALSIAASPAPVGGLVTLIGDGGAITPGDAPTQWLVTQDISNPGHLLWTEVSSGGNAAGYKATTSQKLWGANVIEDDEALFAQMDPDHSIVVNSGNGDVISLFTDFDDPNQLGSGATFSEAQALSGDSGGAVFYKNGDDWELAGVTHAILTFTDQPGLSAVFGDLTLFADLSAYRDQILAMTSVPEAGGFVLLAGLTAGLGATRLAWRRLGGLLKNGTGSRTCLQNAGSFRGWERACPIFQEAPQQR
jgi:hypothetical protein